MTSRAMVGRIVGELAVCRTISVEKLLSTSMTHAEWQVLKDEASDAYNAAKNYLDYICSIEPDPIDP